MIWGDFAVSLPVGVPVKTQPQGQILHDEHFERTRVCVCVRTRAHTHTQCSGHAQLNGAFSSAVGSVGVRTIVLAYVQGKESWPSA